MVRDIVCSSSGCVLEPISSMPEHSDESNDAAIVPFETTSRKNSPRKRKSITKKSKKSKSKYPIKGHGVQKKRVIRKKIVKKKGAKKSPAKLPTKNTKKLISNILNLIKKSQPKK